MSEPVKFKTFRDLRTLPKEQITSNTSIPSIARYTSIASIPSNDNNSKAKEAKFNDISPTRDYQKVPNSVTRVAVPTGMFRGKSKQVWDYFWSISRGAISPTRTFKKSRKEIKNGSGLGSLVTVDAAIEHLQALGLIKVNQTIGSGWGNEYEIFSPDEIELTSTTSTSISSNTSLTQKVDILDIPLSGISSITQTIENKDIYEFPKTSLKTSTKNDDDAPASAYGNAFSVMNKKLDDAVKKLTGKSSSKSEAENWGTLAELLILEMEAAASRTGAISSVPAFLTEVLRRKLLNGISSVSAKSPKVEVDTVGKPNAAGEYEKKPLDEKGRKAALLELRDFAGDDFLENFKKWYTKEDWMWLINELNKINKVGK